VSGAREAARAALLLSTLSCASRPEQAPAGPPDMALSEVREVTLTGRPVALLDTAAGLVLVTREPEGERVSLSTDDGASWSELAICTGRPRHWVAHEGCSELHAVESADDGLHHVRGTGAGSTRSRVVESASVELRSLAAGPDGRLGTLWADSGRGWQELMFSHSDDDGASWSPAVRVNTEGRRKEMTRSLVLVHRDGFVVIWTENRDPRTLFDLYGSYSRDGKRFGPSRRLNDDELPSFSVDPVAVEDGRAVHVLAQDYRESNRFGDRDANVYYARFDLANPRPTPGVRVNDVGDAPQSAPTLARDRATGWLVAAWLDSRHRLTRDLYASVSRDGGASWSANRRVNVNGRPEQVDRPLLAPRRAGGVWVLWPQSHGAVTRHWLRRIAPDEPAAGAQLEEPIPAPLPGPLIDPVPSRRLIAHERFDDDADGIRPLAGSWIVHEGSLLSFGHAPAFAAWAGPPLEDLVVEGRFRLDRREHLAAHLFVRARPVPGEPGVLEGYQLRNHFRIGVFLSRSRVTLGEDRPPSVVGEPIADRWLPLRQETWYDFRVVVSGRRLDYWLDGQWVLSHDDLEPGAGSILLATDARAPVAWDDLAVYSLAASHDASSQ
jgi:hypothetical protein